MITTILWAVIILSIIAIMSVGIEILLLIIGIIAITLGSLSLFSDRFDTFMESKVRPQFETRLDKKFFSKKLGHFVSRYLSGFGLIVVGILMVLAYFFIFKP